MLRRPPSAAWLGLAVSAALLAAAPAGAQEPTEAPRALAELAPRWRPGDWWVVRVYQRDLSRELTSPDPAEGAGPRAPDDPLGAPLPGFPPLRDGVPLGYKLGNRFRLEVVRRELVRYEDDGPADAPEPFVVVALRSLEGTPERTAELWYTEADLTLAKVVLDPRGAARAEWLEGTAQLDVPASLSLGFPLDWPDLAAARRPRAEVLGGTQRLEQRVRVVERREGEPEEHQVRLALVTDDPAHARAVRFTFRPGQPFWSRLVGGPLVAELESQGR